jgi:hypothetical protein
VGIDDEIHIGGDKQAWGEFRVLNGSRILYSTTETLKASGLPPIKAKDAGMPISVAGLNALSSFQLFADQPSATEYPFDFNNAHYNWATAKLYCGPNAPYMPIVRIDLPSGPTERSIGDVVQFQGSAFYFDGVTAITDPAAFQWNVILVHCQVWFIGEYLSTAILLRIGTVSPCSGILVSSTLRIGQHLWIYGQLCGHGPCAGLGTVLLFPDQLGGHRRLRTERSRCQDGAGEGILGCLG